MKGAFANIDLFTTFAVPNRKRLGGLSDGVMVTQQILVLSFKVRALVGQRKREAKPLFFFAYISDIQILEFDFLTFVDPFLSTKLA